MPTAGSKLGISRQHAQRQLGIDIRSGLHTGECEVLAGGADVGRIAVHIGARVAAAPGEVLVSSTVKDLVAGSGLQFQDRGLRTLKGVPSKWRLFAAENQFPHA
jgi:class 3 adenylate cyclase